jgi:transcriptional regulator of acetoin/glycerol metabolism
MASPWAASPNHSPQAIRPVVVESWRRAREFQLDPERLLAPLFADGDDLKDYRSVHPLASVMPVIRKLLVQDADEDSGMLVAVGDAMGRLLWVEGDLGLKRRAESMMFVEGADWSERVSGTSAPGTALAVDHAIQIRRSEHFNLLVHDWSCTAVPVHDPETGVIIGVIDITGGDQAVDRHTLPLMEATAVAVERELLVQRMQIRESSRADKLVNFGSLRESRAAPACTTLRVLGRDRAALTAQSEIRNLSLRHSEIMMLLTWSKFGLSAEALSEAVYGSETHVQTLRAEMVRLRKILETLEADINISSQPYRVSGEVNTDAHHVMSLIERGAHRAALSAYRGSILPHSASPGVREIDESLHLLMRDAILTNASVDVVLAYLETDLGHDDREVLDLALRLLPLKSPKRARIVVRIEALHA